MADRLIPTLLMAQDPRLRRLFALVGKALADGDLQNPVTEDWLRDVLLDLAPEYVPPVEVEDGDLDAPDAEQWIAMVREVIRG